LFLFVEFLPVLEVLVEVDLVCGPEGGKVFLVHLVDGVVLDGEEDEALGVVGEDGLWLRGGREGRRHNDYRI
jgi:hypothetical protein